MAQKCSFMLVHGAFHGGWVWRDVARLLRTLGHQVSCPTLTGLGERRHLLSPEVSLETHVTDVIASMQMDDLKEVVLVGHSYGGAVIDGVLARSCTGVKHRIYLDTPLPRALEAPSPTFYARLAERQRLAEETSAGLSVPPPQAGTFGITDPDVVAWLEERLTPHPVRTWAEIGPLRPEADPEPPCTYVACTADPAPEMKAIHERARRVPGWRWRQIETGHDAMVTAPECLTALLLEVSALASPKSPEPAANRLTTAAE